MGGNVSVSIMHLFTDLSPSRSSVSRPQTSNLQIREMKLSVLRFLWLQLQDLFSSPSPRFLLAQVFIRKT
ncbi:hypothetical protein KOW79_006940 [Hemibagrus wyckioides]|uniref:Uncharacterized protein n=1 Tax=Hemibagrus wyckioides TaxID=337641 RepID=A0A9D3NSQ2_9TELE|nr:hypothetical protein KOW79_006940 [Hemibagrus wyckioides]